MVVIFTKWCGPITPRLIAARCVKYLEARYGQNMAVVFDGYQTEPDQKRSERNRRAQAHSSPEVIFEETTTPNVSQENFLSNDKNKLRFIQLLKVKFEAKHIEVFQAEEDADTLIITTAIRKASDFQVVIIAGEDVDLLVILTGLRGLTQGTIYFQKCGEAKCQMSSTQPPQHLQTVSSSLSLRPSVAVIAPRASSARGNSSCFKYYRSM